MRVAAAGGHSISAILNADLHRIEQQQVCVESRRDLPRSGSGTCAPDAVRRRTPSSSVKVPFRAPSAREMQPEAGIAEIDEVRAGIRQRDHARRVLENGADARVSFW